MIYEENHDNFLISDTLLRQWAMTLMRDQNFFFFFSFLFGREGSRLSGQWLPISTGYTVNSRYKAVRKAGL